MEIHKHHSCSLLFKNGRANATCLILMCKNSNDLCKFPLNNNLMDCKWLDINQKGSKVFRFSREKVIHRFMGCENVNIPFKLRWSILLMWLRSNSAKVCAQHGTHTHTHTRVAIQPPIPNLRVLIIGTYIKIRNANPQHECVFEHCLSA